MTRNPKSAMSPAKAKALAAVGFALAGSLVLAACGAPEAGAAGNDISHSDWVPGPLDEFSARIHGFSWDQNETQQEAQARIDQEGREMEEEIAACMAELGFQYNMRDDAGGTIVIWNSDDSEIEWGTRAFAEEFGLAISTDPWGWNNDDEDGGRDTMVWTDPNQDILDAMSDSERQAWSEALWGPPMEPDADGNWPEWDPMNAGCQGQAQGARWHRQTPDEFLALEEEMNNIWMNMMSDPRIVALQTGWTTCMATAGHPGFTTQDEFHNTLWEEWAELQGWNAMNDVWATWDWEANPDGPTMPEPDPAAVAAFTEREIALAVADWDCRDSLRFNAVQQEVNLELQQQFVDRHRAELEAWAQFEEARRNG